SAAAAVVGAVVGGLAGAAAEEGLTRKDGLEITVKLDNGNMVAVVQEADEQFHPGERVRLIESGGTTRVSHEHPPRLHARSRWSSVMMTIDTSPMIPCHSWQEEHLAQSFDRERRVPLITWYLEDHPILQSHCR